MKKSLFCIIPVVLLVVTMVPDLSAQPFERYPIFRSCPVIINEVMFNPNGSDDDGEFIELYNTSDTETVDISGWTVSDNSGYTADSLYSVYSIGAGGYEIPPNGFAIIVDSDGYDDYEDFLTEYANPDSFIVVEVDDAAIAGGLDNGAEEITIDTDYRTGHIFDMASGTFRTVYATLELSYEHYWEGESLELDRYDDESWIQSPDPNGSTPGIVNSWE